jgi:WD40 repeat protein
MSPDGTLATVESQEHQIQIRFWNIATRQESHRPLSSDSVAELAFSPDRTTLAALCSCGGNYGKVWLWDVATGRQVCEIPGSQPTLGEVDYDMPLTPAAQSSPPAAPAELCRCGVPRRANGLTNGKPGQPTCSRWRIALTGRPWPPQVQTGRSRYGTPPQEKKAAPFVPPIARMSTRWHTAPKVPSLRAGMLTASRSCGMPTAARQIGQTLSNVSDFALSPDGSTIATSAFRGNGVKLWNVHTGQQVGEPFGPDCRCGGSVAYGPDGVTLAVSLTIDMETLQGGNGTLLAHTSERR